MIDEKCPAKINLSLDIVGRREDGYHLVDMIMLSVGLCDDVYISRGGRKIVIECGNESVPLGKDNICYKAAERFLEAADIAERGILIKIDKKIPIGAGLAGGSADAAGVLRGLNRLFGNVFTPEKLKELGAAVGADVPFCIDGGCARAEGIGEILTPLVCGLKNPIVIAKPEFEVSTAQVYKDYDGLTEVTHPNTEAVIRAVSEGNAARLRECTKNVLEDVTAQKHGEINEYKSVMDGCGALFSMMSGSGPSVFGLFAGEADAVKAEEMLRHSTNEVFVTSARC